MHIKVILVLSFVCYFVVGCSYVPDELKNAERLMVNHPDSALRILQRLSPRKYKMNSSHALYGLLLFQALDRNDKPLLPDSLIDSSIAYYLKNNDQPHLAASYFYKARECKKAQKFEEATVFYLKVLECLQHTTDYELMGKVYSDIGGICAFQLDFKESLLKYRTSFYCFNRVGKVIDARFSILSIGRMYRFLKEYKIAQWYYHKALIQIKDSMLIGTAYQEMGCNYYSLNQIDSAEYYFRKSLSYPFKGTNFAIRCLQLSDILFDKGQCDSSTRYAILALKYPATFYTQRDCYRILANVKYAQKDFISMGNYISLYQACTDSIRKLEQQTKATVLEKMNNTTHDANGIRKNMILIVSALIVFLLLSTVLAIFLYKRNTHKRKQLDDYKQQLSQKQEFVSLLLQRKIDETRELQTDSRKNALPDERVRLDKELYYNTLHIDNWESFNKEMNHAFNNIVLTLQTGYPSITHKEIIWCCLHLLDIPHADRMILLNATSDSLYKLKQRLARKLNLKSTKDLDSFLKDLIAIKD